MAHSHVHHQPSNIGNAFKIGIIINIVFVIIEVFYGYVANSMALIADAGHNASDVLILIFSWVAIQLSKKKPTLKYTYGLRKSTILIAIGNSLLLLIAIFFILFETIQRLNQDIQIQTQSVMLIATLGIFVNGFTAWLFIKEKKHDVNIKSAFMHFVADALVSLGVVISGIIMYYTQFIWIDILVTIIILAIILYNTFHILIDSINLALDAVPEHIEIKKITIYLKDLPQVCDIHDLHVWALSSNETALTVHIITKEQTNTMFLTQIQHDLDTLFNIHHTTIQIELESEFTHCHTVCN